MPVTFLMGHNIIFNLFLSGLVREISVAHRWMKGPPLTNSMLIRAPCFATPVFEPPFIRIRCCALSVHEHGPHPVLSSVFNAWRFVVVPWRWDNMEGFASASCDTVRSICSQTTPIHSINIHSLVVIILVSSSVLRKPTKGSIVRNRSMRTSWIGSHQAAATTRPQGLPPNKPIKAHCDYNKKSMAKINSKNRLKEQIQSTCDHFDKQNDTYPKRGE